MKVLLVEDDRLLAQEIARALHLENFAVDIAVNGEDGQHLGETEAYDAAVLDLGLPKVNGAIVLRAWRKKGRHLPVLILTARDGWTD
jgi:two-component system OmpR family response regulator